MKKIPRFILFICAAVILVGFDQWTKHLASNYLKGGREISLIHNVLSLLYVENPGAAFGILHGQQGFFLVITIVVLLGILCVLWKLPDDFRIRNNTLAETSFQKKKRERSYYPLFISLNLIFSGAIGNFIDRQLQSYVVDFIYFSPIDFPVFNVADIYVTSASFLLVILFLFYYKDEDMSFLKRTRTTSEK